MPGCFTCRAELVRNFFANVATEADCEVVAAVSFRHSFSFKVENWERMYPGLVIANTEFTVCILAPTPG